MKTFTIEDIRSWRPYDDLADYFPEDWSGTALDILDVEDCPPWDRLWAVLRAGELDVNTLSRIACRCVRETPLGDGRTVWDLLTDERSRRGVEAREAFLRGEIGDEEMAVAVIAAHDARTAAWIPPEVAGVPTKAPTMAAACAASNTAGACSMAASAAVGFFDAARTVQLQIAREEIEKGAEDENAS